MPWVQGSSKEDATVMKTRVVWAFVLGIALVAPSPGCSSSDSGGTNAPRAYPGVGEHTEKTVTAAAGGVVSGTGVSLSFPAGALSADTTITIDIKDPSGYPDASNIAANVFELGPSGATFLQPVPLTLSLNGQTPPSGSKATIAYLDGSSWKPLDDSVASGGSVTATTTHFSSFTVVWVAGQQNAGGCASMSFSPCGGDLTGTWSFSAACVDFAPNFDPSKGQCPGSSGSASVDMSGTATFNADMTYSVIWNRTLHATITFPAGCSVPCSQVDSAAVSDGAGGCKIDKSESGADSGTYSVSANTFTLTKTGDTPDPPTEYCVTGTTLTARPAPDHNGNQFMFTATKQ